MAAAERTLTAELEIMLQEGAHLAAANLWCSRLEDLLNMRLPLGAPPPKAAAEVQHLTVPSTPSTQSVVAAQYASTHHGVKAPTATIAPEPVQPPATSPVEVAASPVHSAASPVLGPHVGLLYEMAPCTDAHTCNSLLRRRADYPIVEEAITFREGTPLNDWQKAELEELDVPFRYNPRLNGMEDSSVLALDEGALLGGRYRIVRPIGQGSLGRVVQCFDEQRRAMVAIKVCVTAVAHGTAVAHVNACSACKRM